MAKAQRCPTPTRSSNVEAGICAKCCLGREQACDPRETVA